MQSHNRHEFTREIENGQLTNVIQKSAKCPD